ncbi:Oidioi.mRNA.OKI2018_I69.chr1.g3458.t1.cds [Oikopleura dioica]|uniref:Oidioi.mRNA.OKI2018_I69.chr1.g3458.t1.cds n=1 Tax=Oikopleura dioica TaxID=34765 RepID=A0ABN7SU05_OIKDI|nr:Oidioi.mRNA.OKI2018_I69.chr1.g3458.t1.cds [Oikopleura dioica]
MLETPYHRNDILKTSRILKAQTLDGHLAVLTRENFLIIFAAKYGSVPELREVFRKKFNHAVDFAAFESDYIIVLNSQEPHISLVQIFKEKVIFEGNCNCQEPSRIYNLHGRFAVIDNTNSVFICELAKKNIKNIITLENRIPVECIQTVSKNSFIISLKNGLVHLYHEHKSEEFIKESCEFPSAMKKFQLYNPLDCRYAFACADGKIYPGKIIVSDKLTFSYEKDSPLIFGEHCEQGVQQFVFADFNGDSENEIAVLRDDYNIQIWQIWQNEPVLSFSSTAKDNHDFGSVALIYSPPRKRRSHLIVVATSGWIFFLGTEKEKAKPNSEEIYNEVIEEVTKVQTAIDRKQTSQNEWIIPPKINCLMEMKTVASLALKNLIVECETPIEMVQICSTTRVEVVEDKSGNALSNQAVITVNDRPGHEWPMSILFRCQAGTNRLDIKLRPIEGKSGDIEVFCFPYLTINKIILKESFHLPALSLHSPVASLEDVGQYRSFSANIITSWLNDIFIDLPMDTNSMSRFICYRNYQTGSWLRVGWAAGEAHVHSNNPTVLQICKQVLLQHAYDCSQEVDVQASLSEVSTKELVEQILRKFQEHKEYIKNADIVGILRDITLLDDNKDSIPQKYRSMLAKGVKNAELDANLYETLSAVILDLFIDQEKLAGRPGVEKAKDIAESLKDLEFDEVLKFF